MTELLPICIQVNDALEKQFSNINAIKNKLEAQFNFQTLTANWYGDEEKIMSVYLYLEIEKDFLLCKNQLKDKNKNIGSEVIEYSDDVVSCFYQTENKVVTYVSLTTNELALLTTSPKILAILLQTKLLKVLNLTAKKLALPLLQY